MARKITRRVRRSLSHVAEELGADPGDAPFREILGTASSRLRAIGQGAGTLPAEGAPRLRVLRDEPPPPPQERPIRLGVFPVNGNPLHWGHLLCALTAIAELPLDAVVFVIQGIDKRKPASIATHDHRHAMARRVLAPFEPLLRYSDLGWGDERVGEDHLFRLLRANARQRIEAHYVVGGDHYRLRDPQGNPDTLLRIERNMADPAYAFDPGRHSIRVVFVERGARGPAVPTRLDVRFLPEVLDVSSTAVRRGSFAFTPYEALSYMQDEPAYADAIGR